jgi:hypothetical protein
MTERLDLHLYGDDARAIVTVTPLGEDGDALARRAREAVRDLDVEVEQR